MTTTEDPASQVANAAISTYVSHVLNQFGKWPMLSRITARLEVGAREYGDASFERPIASTLDEILDELADVAGWAIVISERVRRLKEAAARLDPMP